LSDEREASDVHTGATGCLGRSEEQAMARSLIDRHRHHTQKYCKEVLRETQLEEMEIEQNTISRDWTVLHEGRRFYVNFTESDGQTLALCNRENWQIQKGTENGIEEFGACVFKDSSLTEREQAQENVEMIDELRDFCLAHWENEVAWEMTENMEMQNKGLAG
jgi:hypothetical protein